LRGYTFYWVIAWLYLLLGYCVVIPFIGLLRGYTFYWVTIKGLTPQ
jgi:hypothetical protein